MAASEVAKLLYVVVIDADEVDKSKNSFRYTRSALQSTLQLMGCKPRHAFKISKRVFDKIRSECLGNGLASDRRELSAHDASKVHPLKDDELYTKACLDKSDGLRYMVLEDEKSESKPFELYKRRTTVVVERKTFLDVVCNALTEYKYVGPNQRADLVLACRFRERKESVIVLLCGTSGTGKSTLSALLAGRLGITTVISTDSIRHMMRSFVDEKENPLLWASTYHAGEYLDPVAVAEAKAKRKEKKLDGITSHSLTKEETSDVSAIEKSSVELISPKRMAVEGFKAQSEMVIDSLDRLITAWEERKESVVVEGVHLSLNFVMGLMKKHPSIIPFMIYIASEEKHLERFAVRAKYMTLDPAKNKYVKYIRNIRTIQEYLCNRADKHLVPKINNTNVDRSVAAIHATVFSCLRRRETGEQLYDAITNTAFVVDEEYRNQCAANTLSSKGMLQLIQRKGSTRHLMALLNNDGSVAKAWPVDSVNFSGNTFTGSVHYGKAEPVNLHFGHFGIRDWLNDTGGTSHASSVDESRGDDNSSRHYSSCCSSPRISEGHAKELKEENSVHGSDEEVDDPPEVETDEDLSDDGREQIHEEMEGSVDEESSKSDEEYEDLAIQDTENNGYWSDNNEEGYKIVHDERLVPSSGNRSLHELNCGNEEKNKKSFDHFLRTKSETQTTPLQVSSPFLREKSESSIVSASGNTVRMTKRSQSIPALGSMVH